MVKRACEFDFTPDSWLERIVLAYLDMLYRVDGIFILNA